MATTIAQVLALEPGDVVRLESYGHHGVTVQGAVVALDSGPWVGDVVRLTLRDGGLPYWVASADLTVLKTAASPRRAG